MKNTIKIPFNKPYLTGKEAHYLYDASISGHLSGNGKYTKLCHRWFEEKYGFKKVLLTTSCTDALEMASILLEIKEGDEVIVPSYTFVSSANPFVMKGANIVFADSQSSNPNIDLDEVEKLISTKTKAIVVVHYAGFSCDMERLMSLAEKHGVYVIEDAAHAIDNYYRTSAGETRPLGGIGHIGVYSFHETKNIISGEGGLLIVNDKQFIDRAEIIWEKGTNRSAFFRGDVDKYGWVDIGSSFLPSDIIAAFLWSQLEHIELIQNRRKFIWNAYHNGLKEWARKNNVKTPTLQENCSNNAHMYFLVFEYSSLRDDFISHMKSNGINAVFHYLSLHKSPFYHKHHDGRELHNSDYFSNCLVRLPLFVELDEQRVIDVVRSFQI